MTTTQRHLPNRHQQYAAVATASARLLELLRQYGASNMTMTNMQFAIADALGDTPDLPPVTEHPPAVQDIATRVRTLGIDLNQAGKGDCRQADRIIADCLEELADKVTQADLPHQHYDGAEHWHRNSSSQPSGSKYPTPA